MSSRHNHSRDETIPLSENSEKIDRAPNALSSIRLYQNFDALPSSYSDFFAECGRSNYYLSGAWFERLFQTCARSGDSLRLYCYEEHGLPVGALVTWHKAQSPDFLSGRRLSGLSNWYSAIYGPLIASSAGRREDILSAIIARMATETPRWDSFHMGPFDAQSAEAAAMVSAFQKNGLSPIPQPAARDWYEPVSGFSFDDYLKTLSSKKRNTLRRKEKHATANGGFAFKLYTDAREIDQGIADYQKIYAASWKEPEEFADFIPSLIRQSAQDGSLRLGIVSINGAPAASELGIVAARSAMLMKTAYDPQFQNFSVGALAIYRTLQHILDTDDVDEIDFGLGDDPYKREWVSHSRERVWIAGLNRRTVRGMLGASYNIIGRLLKRDAAGTRNS